MYYSEFGIIIESEQGVCPVGNDTLMLARAAKDLPHKRCLDMGTGSGFIAIYLASLGAEVTAVDQNTVATQTATDNAVRNKVHLTIHTSDLFKHVEGIFDLIVFNPPYGTTTHISYAPLLERIKSMIPRNSALIAKLTYPFIRKGRIQLIKRFLCEASAHIHENTNILMCLHKSELDLVSAFPVKRVGEDADMHAVVFLAHPVVRMYV